MPAVKNSKIKAAIKDHIAGKREGISRYTIRSQEKEFTFRLIITPKPGLDGEPEKMDDCLVFATNHQWENEEDAMQAVPKQYRMHWGIENGYKSIRPRTASMSRSIRLFLFFIGL